MRYSIHQDAIIALVSYLALTDRRSRSPHGLARDLNFDEATVLGTLQQFPGLFRRSVSKYRTDAGDDYHYTLHARYARRRVGQSDQAGWDGTGEELGPEILTGLLSFVAEQARHEAQDRERRVGQVWLVVGVAIAAVASVIAAVIQAAGG